MVLKNDMSQFISFFETKMSAPNILTVKFTSDINIGEYDILTCVRESLSKYRHKNKKTRKYNISFSRIENFETPHGTHDVLIVKNGLRFILNSQGLYGYDILDELNFEDILTNKSNNKGINMITEYLTTSINEALPNNLQSDDNYSPGIRVESYEHHDHDTAVAGSLTFYKSLDSIVTDMISTSCDIENNDFYLVIPCKREPGNEGSEIPSELSVQETHVTDDDVTDDVTDDVIKTDTKSSEMQEDDPNIVINRLAVVQSNFITYKGPSGGKHMGKLYNLGTERAVLPSTYNTRRLLKAGAIVVGDYILIPSTLLPKYRGDKQGEFYVIKSKKSTNTTSEDIYIDMGSREYIEMTKLDYRSYSGFLIPEDRLTKPCKEQLGYNSRVRATPKEMIEEQREQYHNRPITVNSDNTTKQPDKIDEFSVHHRGVYDGSNFQDRISDVVKDLTKSLTGKQGKISWSIDFRINTESHISTGSGIKNSDGIYIENTASSYVGHNISSPKIVIDTYAPENGKALSANVIRQSPAQLKVVNPKTKRPINVDGVVYKSLLKEGYLLKNGKLIK
jgi:hypothetical protein